MYSYNMHGEYKSRVDNVESKTDFTFCLLTTNPILFFNIWKLLVNFVLIMSICC